MFILQAMYGFILVKTHVMSVAYFDVLHRRTEPAACSERSGFGYTKQRIEASTVMTKIEPKECRTAVAPCKESIDSLF